ncbi:MAG: phosphoribosylaminoimidazolesuccinocarboxamide synthase [Bdellovibrio sp.]|nr:phosphoribosylaminoimidazolesuccinocarboxamide synthase [Bdellovibrio sp.]
MTQKLIYEGKAKKIFETSNPNELMMEYKDSLTAFNALKKGEFSGKGQLNCQISTHLFKLLSKNKIPHHWIRTENKNQMVVVKTKIIPLEVVVRNIIAGSLAKKLGIEEGRALKKPLVELYYKDDALGDPFVSDDQAFEFGWAQPDQLQQMKKLALTINEILTPSFAEVGLKVVDFKLEFGLDPSGVLVLADEISPDCMRLWDMQTNEKMDKDRFRRDLGNIEGAYKQVLERIERIQV